MRTWKPETLIARLEAAVDDHARTRQWRKDTLDEVLRKRYRNRLWTIRKSITALEGEILRRIVVAYVHQVAQTG